MLDSKFSPIHGIWARFSSSARGSYRRTIDDCPLPINLTSMMQLSQEDIQKLFPNSCLVPADQPPATSISGREFACSRQYSPRNSSSQDKDDTGENLPRISTSAPRVLDMTIFPSRLWKERLDTTPEIIGHDRLRHNKISRMRQRALSLCSSYANGTFNFVTRSKYQKNFFGICKSCQVNSNPNYFSFK